MHSRDILYISYCDAQFFGTSAPSAPFSLFTCCYLLASAFHRLYWLLSHQASSFDLVVYADLRSLRWYGIERLALGWGRLHANCSSGDARYDFSLLHLKWKNLFEGVQISGNLNTRGKPSKRGLFPTDLQNLTMPRL
jgi:hypothetical protein